MAKDITDEFASEPVTVLCVLKGGYRFFADLCDKMMLLSQTATQPTPVSVDFIRVSSYVVSINNINLFSSNMKHCNVLNQEFDY